MSMSKFDGIKTEKAPDSVIPKCPFCKEKLKKIWIKTKGLGVMEQNQIIMCPSCESFLGYGVFSR